MKDGRIQKRHEERYRSLYEETQIPNVKLQSPIKRIENSSCTRLKDSAQPVKEGSFLNSLGMSIVRQSASIKKKSIEED